MPTYAYRCTACDHAFEAQQSFTDDALTVCPQCDGRLRKVFSAVGVVFKGSGFYRNDARKGSGSSTSSASSASSGGSSSTSSASTSSASGSGSSSSGASGGAGSGSSGSSAPAASKPAAASA